MCAYAFKSKVNCGSVFEKGASGLPCYFTPPVCVPDVIGGLAVWRHNDNKNKLIVPVVTDPCTPGCLRFVDTRKPWDRIDFPIPG